MNSGWILLYRKMQEHWLYPKNRTFTKFEAWIDLIFCANYKEKKVNIGNQLIEVNRGETIKSLDTWAKRWKWNKSKVRRVLKLFEKSNMIETKSERMTTRITICNYESYQGNRHAADTQVKRKRNANRHASETKSTRKPTQITVCNYESYQDDRHADETQMKRKRNASETQTDTKRKERKNEKNEKNEYSSISSSRKKQKNDLHRQNKQDEHNHSVGNIKERSVGDKKGTSVPGEENKYITASLFDTFWKMYPRKVDKGKVKTIWERLCNKKTDRPKWDDIKLAIIAQKQTDRWQELKFIPHPSTWLNQSRWEDDPAEMKSYKSYDTETTKKQKPANWYREKRENRSKYSF